MTTKLLPESTWTPSRPDCPYPERWSSVDAYATESEVTELVAAMVRALQPEFVIETGSWVGTTTQAIGEALVRNGHGELISLEISPDMCQRANQRCEYLPWMHHRTVVGFHDTGPQHPVRALLAPLEAAGVLTPLYLPTPRGVCFSRVNGAR